MTIDLAPGAKRTAVSVHAWDLILDVMGANHALPAGTPLAEDEVHMDSRWPESNLLVEYFQVACYFYPVYHHVIT